MSLINNTRFFWRRIKDFPNNKVIRYSLLWIVVIPVFVKILNRISFPLTIRLRYLDEDIVFILDLPFTWELFYLSALSFFIGNILYFIFCPRLIRFFNNLKEYKETKRGFIELVHFLPESLKLSYNKKIDNILTAQTEHLAEEEKVDLLNKSLKSYFLNTYEKLNKSKRAIRLAILISYGIGTVILTFVFLENVVYVLEFVFKN